MDCPYEHEGELYHKCCLPEAEDAVELPQYIEVRTFRPYKYIVDYFPSEES